MTSKVTVKAIVDGKFYDVKVGRVVNVANQKFRPCHEYRVRGTVLKELGDAVVESSLASAQQ